MDYKFTLFGCTFGFNLCSKCETVAVFCMYFVSFLLLTTNFLAFFLAQCHVRFFIVASRSKRQKSDALENNLPLPILSLHYI